MAIGNGSWVFFNDPVFGVGIPALVIANSAGVCNLSVHRPDGTIKHFAGVAGATSPSAGQYDSDTFPTPQAS